MRAVLAASAEDFANVRRQIALDPKASASDRLAAIRDLETRVLGKPTERVEHAVEIPQLWQDWQKLSYKELLEVRAQLASDLPLELEAAEDAEWTEG